MLVVKGARDAALDDLDQVTRRLREELRDLDVESVTLATSGVTPSGTKSAEALAIGSLVVTLLPEVLPRLIEFLQQWSLRDKERSVTIKVAAADRSIELACPANMSRDEIDNLVRSVAAALPSAV